MKRFSLIIAAFLLSFTIVGCNGADDNGTLTEDPQNEVHVIGDNAGQSNDLAEDLEQMVSPDFTPVEDVLESFMLLAMEMNEGDYTVRRDRLIELFGLPRFDDENLMDFDVAVDFGIIALLSDDRVIVISIDPIPDFFIDESLDPDYERLMSYVNNTDGLTLEYFEELFGTPGFLAIYTNGVFSYSWRSSAFTFWVDVRGDYDVVSVTFEDHFLAGTDEVFDQSILVIPDDTILAIDELVREMQDNDGAVSDERVKEIINKDYVFADQRIVFPIVDGADFFVIVEDDGMVRHAIMSLTGNFFLNEPFEIDSDEMEELINNAPNMTLGEFVDSIGDSGTLWRYTFNEFTYMWISPEATIMLVANQDNEIIDVTYTPFGG